jgi:hypothetical protein
LNGEEDDNDGTDRSNKSNNDNDIERLKKELVADQDEDASSENDYMTALKAELESKNT